MSTTTLAAADAPGTPVPGTDELLHALRSLLTCTRKVRSWVTDAGSMTVLGVVAEHGETRVSSVASALLMDVSTISRSLAALCRDGLVQWRSDEKDLRSHLVSCTPAGIARLTERRLQIRDELALRLESWPEPEVAELSRLLNRFVSDVLAGPARTTALTPSTAPTPSNVEESA
jgi:DNA-binding MarR family transcriptional regulator